MRTGIQLHKGLFNETLPTFLRQQPRSRPLAWANIDCDLYQGAREALELLTARLRPATLLHFHDIIAMGPDAAATLGALRTKGLLPRPSDEARALHAWLRSHPHVVLELLPVTGSPVEAAAFRVRAGV